MFLKICFARFPPFIGRDIRVNIKIVFSPFFPTIFFPTFFVRTSRVFLENLFRAFSPPLFGSRYSCEYKNRCFALFPDDLFSHIFFSHYSCVSGKVVSRVFPPIFWSRYSCENKKGFFLLFSDNFFKQFFPRTIGV